MTPQLEELTEGISRLIAALDGRDAEAITMANDLLADAVTRISAIGAWHDTRDALKRIDHALELAEAARIRVNLLSDMTQRQIELMDTLRTDRALAGTYERQGRLRRARA